MSEVNKSLAGDVLGAVLTEDLKRELLNKLFSWLGSAIGGLLHKKPKPTTPVTSPVHNDGDGKDADDMIPEPKNTSARKVSRVRVVIYKIQLNAKRFPNAPNGGLLDNPRQYEDGSSINWGSKVWLDVTAYDQDGKEFLPPAVIDSKLAFTPEIHLGGAYIKGVGADPSDVNRPAAGYEQVSDDLVGQGITAWESTLGFVQQFKVFGEGKFEAWAVVAGVTSNKFTVSVS